MRKGVLSLRLGGVSPEFLAINPKTCSPVVLCCERERVTVSWMQRIVFGGGGKELKRHGAWMAGKGESFKGGKARKVNAGGVRSFSTKGRRSLPNLIVDRFGQPQKQLLRVIFIYFFPLLTVLRPVPGPVIRSRMPWMTAGLVNFVHQKAKSARRAVRFASQPSLFPTTSAAPPSILPSLPGGLFAFSPSHVREICFEQGWTSPNPELPKRCYLGEGR